MSTGRSRAPPTSCAPTSSACRCCCDACLDGGGRAGSCTSPPTRSTASIDDRDPGTEDAPLAPNSPYAAAKAGGDLLAPPTQAPTGCTSSITRCCNNYGPYQYPEKVIPLFVTNLIAGGKPSRSTATAGTSATGSTSTTTAGASSSSPRGAIPARSTTSTATRADQPSSSPPPSGGLRRRTGTWWSPSTDRKGHDRRYTLDDSLLRARWATPRASLRGRPEPPSPGTPTTAGGGNPSTGPRRPRDPPTAETSHEQVADHGGQRDARP